MTSTDFFDQFNEAIQSKCPFVFFSTPESQSIKAYIQTNSETYCIEDYSESGFVFAPFDANKNSYYIPLETSRVLKLEHLDFEVRLQSNPLNYEDPTKEHLKLVSSALDAITTTDLEKVVLSRAFKFNLESSNPIETFKTLVHSYPSAFTYCWYHPQTGFWFGASPEQLLKLEGRSLSTMALAGTQAVNLGKAIEWDVKNREEHAFVTDYLVKVLSNYLEPIKISDPQTHKAGELLHLKTHVTGRLKSSNYSLKALLKAIVAPTALKPSARGDLSTLTPPTKTLMTLSSGAVVHHVASFTGTSHPCLDRSSSHFSVMSCNILDEVAKIQRSSAYRIKDNRMLDSSSTPYAWEIHHCKNSDAGPSKVELNKSGAAGSP